MVPLRNKSSRGFTTKLLSWLSEVTMAFRIASTGSTGKYLILAICLSAGIAKADQFTITLSGSESGTGSLTTSNCFSNGVCTLSQLTVSIGADSGPSAFDMADDTTCSPLYNTVDHSIDGNCHFNNSENTTDELFFFEGSPDWQLNVNNQQAFSGTFTITPAVPEPSSVLLLVSVVGMVGFLSRRTLARSSTSNRRASYPGIP
jgi:hypothetical protein